MIKIYKITIEKNLAHESRGPGNPIIENQREPAQAH